jgi:hypothetical protein
LIIGSQVFNHFKENLIRYVLPNHGEEDEENHCLDLFGDGWKWYDDHSDVQAWMKFMFDAEEMGLEFEFIRVGEGDGDEQDVQSHRSTNSSYLLSVTNPRIEEDFNKGEEIPVSWDIPIQTRGE